MPVHRAATDAPWLEEYVARIEADERIIQVVHDGGGSVLIFTEPTKAARQSGQKETR